MTRKLLLSSVFGALATVVLAKTLSRPVQAEASGSSGDLSAARAAARAAALGTSVLKNGAGGGGGSTTGQALLPVRTTRFLLLGENRDVVQAMARPFDQPWDVTVGARHVAHRLTTCNDYLAVATEEIDTNVPSDQRYFEHAASECQAFSLLAQATASGRSFVDGLRIDAKAPRWLPAAFYLDLSRDEGKRVAAAMKAGRSWKAFDPKIHLEEVNEQFGLQFAGSGYGALVAEYGRGDFDHDGTEDILVRTMSAPEGGSLRMYGVFVLTRTNETGPVKVLRSWRRGY